MNYQDFIENTKKVLSAKQTFQNPGGGTSIIVSVSDVVRYKRKNSTIAAPLEVFFKAYLHFKGKRCSSKDLKAFDSSIFDSSARPAGHSCNCTFFFMLLNELKLSSEIKGKGVAGSPFYV